VTLANSNSNDWLPSQVLNRQ